MAVQKKTVDAKDFYSDSIGEYLENLRKIKADATAPLIRSANVDADKALNAVNDLLSGKVKDKQSDKNLIKLAAKKGGKPVVKKVYQSVLMTFFKTNEVEYDYSYSLNGDTINMSPKRISVNEGYAEFTSATQCFVGDLHKSDRQSLVYEKTTDDTLTKTPESGYVIANLKESDFKKESKESVRQYNEKLKRWLEEFQQQQLGKARRLWNVTIYDKEYTYNELILLVPFILVSYDCGDAIVTFSVNAVTGNVEAVLLNNPLARFEYDGTVAAPSFNVLLFLLASVAVVIFGGVLYILWYLSKKLTYKKKSLNGYTLSELRKLL